MYACALFQGGIETRDNRALSSWGGSMCGRFTSERRQQHKESSTMPDRRGHRGPHPKDRELFDPKNWPKLQQAASEICWLLDRGYPPAASLKLVGDRHQLVERQRTAIARCACSADDARRRREHRVPAERLAGETLWIGGYNVLVSIEAALSGGVILRARDGSFRDLVSMHGTYRKVAETVPAIRLLGAVIADSGVARCHWWLDRPVSNSGRLMQLLTDVADEEMLGLAYRWLCQQRARDDIVRGAADLGVDLDEHIQFVIDSLAGISGELGLTGESTHRRGVGGHASIARSGN